MNKPVTVGVTGGIGAGKTLVTKIFTQLGVPIYYADASAKKLMQTKLVEPITSAFGAKSYLNGTLNRTFLAAKVYSDKNELERLNAIVHPAVAVDFENWVQGCSNAEYVIKEAALLVETGSYKQLDKLIVVTAPLPVRVKRIKLRDSFRSQQEIEGIIANQSSDEEKIKLADFVITNDEKSLLIPQVIKIDKKIRQH